MQPIMHSRLPTAVLVAGLAFMASPSHGVEDEKTAKICAQSAERYKELFGKMPDEEPVTIVTMYKYRFCPVSVTVKVGSIVRFVNIDKRTSHSVWFKEAGKPESDRLFPDDIVEIRMETAGEFGYLCGPHWESDGMTGKITVEE